MYYIGIDGGGTKSDFVVLDEEFNVLNTAKSQATNINSHGVLFVTESIRNGLNRLLEGLAIVKNDFRICLASAGVDQPSDKIVYEEILKELGYESFSVVNDSEAALSAGTKGKDGIIVIAGTGSIAFGKKDNQVIRAGGWGHIIGDEGSGYSIAINAIKEVLYDADGHGSETILSKRLLEAINAETVSGFIDFIYKQNFSKDRVAALATIVDEAANEGDEVAISILKKEAKLLVKQVKAIKVKLFNNQNNVPVILNGSVIKNSQIFNKTFMDSFSSTEIHCIPLDCSASIGAAYLAKV